MKKYLLLVCFVFLLGSCGNRDSVDNTDKSNTKDDSAIVETSNSTIAELTDTKEVTNGKLLTPGEWTKDSNIDGKVLLTKIATPKQEIILGELTLLIEDIKILLSEGSISDYYVNQNENSVDGKYYTLQISYKIINNSEYTIGYNGIDKIVTDKGQQINVLNEDISQSRDTSEFLPKTTSKTYSVITYLNHDNANEINEITIYTGETFNLPGYDFLNEGTSQSFKLK